MFSSTNDKKTEGVSLKKGEKIKIKTPESLLKMGNCTITNWNCEIGDIIKPGDILCTLESEKKELIFEAFLHGKINYRNISNGKLTKDSVIVEIVVIK